MSADLPRRLGAEARAHPARLRILRLLLATPGSIGGDILEAVGLARSTAPETLRIPKAADGIPGEVPGPRICHAPSPDSPEPLAEFIGALTPPSARACRVPDAKETS